MILWVEWRYRHGARNADPVEWQPSYSTVSRSTNIFLGHIVQKGISFNIFHGIYHFESHSGDYDLLHATQL